MMPTFEDAGKTLSKLWLAIIVFNALAITVFTFSLFPGLSIPYLFILLTIAMVVGLVIGIEIKFRSICGISSAIFRFFYFLLVMELMFGGGTAAMALKIAGRQDLRWLAFYTNSLVIVLFLFAGMAREGLRLELWGEDKSECWKQKLGKYIDYIRHQVSPAVMDISPSPKQRYPIQSSIWIVAAGGVNIPLLFEIYGGGRNNAVFLAAPLLTMVFAFVNLKTIGPSALRLWLLRKLEKSAGRPFINADYERIQELRRTFFLSRWLMKDYVAPVCAAPDQAHVSERKTPKQLKRRRKS